MLWKCENKWKSPCDFVKKILGNNFYQTIFTKGLVTISHYSLWLSLRFYYAPCLIDHNLSQFFFFIEMLYKVPSHVNIQE